MGGAKSKFEQTDWIRANGKLTKREQTIDGGQPTAAYGVYFLKKEKLNQREFTVTDLEKNLLYTTKCVPGTLCWFDVYGRGIDDCLLRVQVDLSRRFWVVYRMGMPCFKGQLADIEATNKFANDRRENGDDLTATPFLFRKCCIAVSWSRYMAVAMHYGAPQSKDSNASDAEQDSQVRCQSWENDEKVGAPVNQDDIEEGDKIDTEQKIVYDASSATASGIHASLANSSSDRDPVEQPHTNTLTGWVQKQRQAIKDNKKKKLRTDPNEGILHLDKPLVLCQEIYDKMVGNHQTSVLSKKQAIALLRKDIEQHENDADTSGDSHAFLADQDWIFAQLTASNEEQQGRLEDSNNQIAKQCQVSIDANDDCLMDSVDTRQNDNGDTNSEKSAPAEHGSPTQVVDKTKSHPGNADEEKKEETEQFEGSTARLWNKAFKSQKSKLKEPERETGNDLDEDGIIGYFKWENSLFSQEVKMHLAEGSDLALHVVLAIIVNQVRYERNAIAMMV